MVFLRLTIILLLVFVHTVSAANSAMYYNHWNLPTASRSRRLSSSSHQNNNFGVASLVARKKKEKAPEPSVPAELPQPPVVNFDDLGPIGKVVAGVTQIVVTTGLEYVSGFFAGFFLGTAVGVPGVLFRPVEPGVPTLFMTEVKGRLGRMNTRSMAWAKNWAGISAAFGCFKVAVRVVRNGKEDDWNQILSSAAAGAFFARAEGPPAMVKGALLYGGGIYLLSGGFGGKNQQLQQYTEKPVDF